MATPEIRIRTVAVVGVGVIGASWAAHYLAHGFDVIATDPAAGAEDALRARVQTSWPVLERLGLASGASQARLTFTSDLAGAVAGADFVQENGPERIDLKRELIAAIDAAAGDQVIIATSSSGLLVSSIQDAAKHPERVLVGHPFNPPHLIPLVEVVGGRLTSPEALSGAMAFYRSVGKKPIHIRCEVEGHVANRLQAALWREAFYLVQKGVISVSDIDTAIAYGPGLRWALLGPLLNLHLSGGDGGIAYALEHLGPAIESWWKDLGEVSLSQTLRDSLIAGVDQELKPFSRPELVRQRDDVLVSLLALKAKSSELP